MADISTFKTCPKCAMQIPQKAIVCPHCRKTIGMSMTKKVVLGFLCLIIAAPFLTRGVDPLPSNPSALSSTPTAAIERLNFPPKKAYQHKYKFKTEYEKINNYTTVGFDNMKLGNGLSLRAFFVSTGKVVTTPKTVLVTFVSSTEDWRYLQYRPIYLLLNGAERLTLGVPENNTSVHSGSVLEQMSIEIPIEIYLKIVNSNSIEGSIGITKFNFKKSQIEALRDFATKMI